MQLMVQIFDQIGMGQWFRIVTGLVEVRRSSCSRSMFSWSGCGAISSHG